MALRGVLQLLFAVLLCVNVDSLQAVQVGGNGTLQVGYYWRTCPQAERIVKEEVAKAVFSNYGLAAGLVRLHFHDCFVKGCDGSVLIDSTSNNVAEKDAPPNNPSLRGFEVIDSAKARLESLCSQVVSCADILAFAARDSVQFSGGLPYQVPAGRKDGRISQANETISLPPPTSNLSQLTQMFANKGLNQGEMVTLSGAHTIGRSHCSSFSKRLYNFNTTMSQDPSLDPAYAAQLKQQCPNSSVSANLTVPMDPRTPNLLDTSYYSGILANRGLFTSDQTLLSNSSTAALVQQNAHVSSALVSELGIMAIWSKHRTADEDHSLEALWAAHSRVVRQLDEIAMDLFIKGFSLIMAPIMDCLKHKHFQWTSDQQNSFEAIKSMLSVAPVLALPDFKKTFHVHTDASSVGALCSGESTSVLGALPVASRFHSLERSYKAL
ncbi:hypothetical protein KFK09_007955 [Dendrobium nobile]|uniref:Peroxidase 1 n=1 Tax=Dendrobium nobile TaxID=94219 RepID=A0A8T3BVS0_DENNO|nr:hypothetical protein KFK09_007955 [Dendrobium nobile]